MFVRRRVTPSSKFAGTHLYTWVKRGTMRVQCLAQEHNAVPQPRIQPGPALAFYLITKNRFICSLKHFIRDFLDLKNI